MQLHLPDNTVLHFSEETVSVAKLLTGCNINPFEVIVTRNGKLIPEDATVSGDDDIRVFPVAHGG
jgi:sulfur carrier protein ThiS